MLSYFQTRWASLESKGCNLDRSLISLHEKFHSAKFYTLFARARAWGPSDNI